MEQKQCKRCGKIIEGFSHKDLEHRLLMHSMTHRKEIEQEELNQNTNQDGTKQ